MYAFFVVVAALVVLATALVATGRAERLLAASPDRLAVPLPEGEVAPDDLAAVRFPVAVRGYRMAEVDATLDRLSGELASRDARIAALHQQQLGRQVGGHTEEEPG